MFSKFPFLTTRVPVVSTRGMVASTQPLASEAGLRILRQGGNAADAAIAVASALNVTEPCSTGIGGDACAIYYNAKTKSVKCLLGYGRSSASFTRESIIAAGFEDCKIPPQHGLNVTVPGAAQLWEDVLTHWGQHSLKSVLAPAIELCEEGFAVAPITAEQWKNDFHQLQGDGCYCFKASSGKAPIAGDVLRNPDLAQTFRTISEEGTQRGFYHGQIANAIVEAVKEFDGVLSLDDLDAHKPVEPVTPIKTGYRGYTVWEISPPSQGVVVLAALNHLEELLDGVANRSWGSDDVLHAQIEALRLGFFDALQFNADPNVTAVDVERMICKNEASRQRKDMKLSRQASSLKSRASEESTETGVNTDTVYFCVVDGKGNACSCINSNFQSFGTGIVPKCCGFSLHNRGHGFSLAPTHPNTIAPSKRPYNTIIPGICTDRDGDLFAAFGVMGAFMQPQGHLQVLSNLIDFNMHPQAALDAPRFCLSAVDTTSGPKCVEESKVCFEDGFSEEVMKALKDRGHQIELRGDCFFGRGQIILRTPDGVLWGGTDPRAPGIVLGY